MITVADAQRINTRRNRAQEVCVSRRPRSLRPTIAGVTNVVEPSGGYIPATDKNRLNLFPYYKINHIITGIV